MYVMLDHQLTPEAVEGLGETLSAVALRPGFPLPDTGTGYLATGGFTWWLDLDMNFRSPSKQLAEIGHIGLDLPRGMTLGLGQHLVRLSPPVHWHAFVHDPEKRDAVRTVVRLFAPVLGARAAIYLADMQILRHIDDRRSLAWMIDWLDGRKGPPAMTVESLKDDGPWGVDREGYWMESLT